MSIWIEFRCENRANPSSGSTRRDFDRCESHDNNGPQGLVNESRDGLLFGVRQLEAKARANGWKRTKYGWICPFCMAQKNVMAELKDEHQRAKAPQSDFVDFGSSKFR